MSENFAQHNFWFGLRVAFVSCRQLTEVSLVCIECADCQCSKYERLPTSIVSRFPELHELVVLLVKPIFARGPSPWVPSSFNPWVC